MSLLDECAFEPYKGRRLRGAFRFINGSAVYSRDAVRVMLEHHEDDKAEMAAEVREDEEKARLLARDFDGDAESALRLGAKFSRVRRQHIDNTAPPARVASSWEELLALPERDRSVLRLIAPVDLKDSRSPKPALMLNERGELVVCESSGETQAMKSEDGAAGGHATLECFSPAGVGGAGAPPFVASVDADAFAQRVAPQLHS